MYLQPNYNKSDFPADFIWGVSTSSFQIEGATEADGRGPSIWDSFCRQDGAIADASDGTVACDHYNRLEQDLDLLTKLGVNSYRFSMSWPRVQPDGSGAWNEAGFAFYQRLLEGLKARNIKAHLTLYHWDLPQALQDAGGWNNRAICSHFVAYAREVVRRFAPMLASITTHNEPWVVAVLGHKQGIFAPGIKDKKIANQVAHHLLVSHGMAVRAMRELAPTLPMGIVLNQSPIHPASDSEADRAAARLEDGKVIRSYMDPLFKGRYPQDIWLFMGAHAPEIELGDMQLIQQPLDFLGLNYYTRYFASASGNADPKQLVPNAEFTAMDWEVYPQGLTELLLRLHQDYVLPQIFITENGAAFADQLEGERVADASRVSYLQEHLAALLDARRQGVPIGGYFAWSLLDNFEWASGYSKRFGIVYVDYNTQRRYVKDSGYWYRDFLQSSANAPSI